MKKLSDNPAAIEAALDEHDRQVIACEPFGEEAIRRILQAAEKAEEK